MIENIKKFWHRYVDKNWALIVVLLTLGTILSILAWALDNQDSRPVSETLISAAGNLGHTILAAGFFATFLKTFQFIGVFKDEIKGLVDDNSFRDQIHQLIFTKETLRHASQETKRKIWSNLTHNLYDTSMPDDCDSLLTNKILHSYLPDQIDFIQRDFRVKYEVSYRNGDVVYRENCRYDIIPIKDTAKLKASYFVWRKTDSNDNSDVTIITFKVGGTDVLNNFVNNPTKDKGYDVVERNLEVSLKGIVGTSFEKGKPITVKSVIEIKNTPLISPHFRYQFSQYTKGFEIDFVNNSPEDIVVKLELIDNRIDLREILEESTSLKNENELLLPTDGYLLIVTPKNWK